MTELLSANLVIVIVALVIGLIIAWWIFAGRGASAVEAKPADAPIAAEPAVAEPAPPEPEPAALPEAKGPPDNLQQLKGVGPKLAARLNEIGLSRFDQIAALTPDQAAAVDAQLGTFNGRLARDRVVEQASYLAEGDTEGFQAKFGSLGSGAG